METKHTSIEVVYTQMTKNTIGKDDFKRVRQHLDNGLAVVKGAMDLEVYSVEYVQTLCEQLEEIEKLCVWLEQQTANRSKHPLTDAKHIVARLRNEVLLRVLQRRSAGYDIHNHTQINKHVNEAYRHILIMGGQLEKKISGWRGENREVIETKLKRFDIQ